MRPGTRGKKMALNKQDLINGFCKAGINKGDEIEVHSSLSSFGYVDGGPETVISALKETVGDNGSIFMPALRLSPELPLTEEDKKAGITSKIKILPENRTHSAMGIIADTFRMMPDTVTGDGIFAVSGWGRNANEAAKGGLDYVIKHGGKALLLGVDIYKLTAMHYAEDILPERIRKLFAPSSEIQKKYPPEEWFIEAGEPPVKPWYAIQAQAYEKGLIREGYIGSCKYMCFGIWDVVGLYRQALETDPLGLYGLR